MATQSNKVEIQIGDEVRVLEGDELIAFNNMRAELQAEAEARKAAAEAEAETKAQAKAQLLAQLGITEEQAKLLLS